MQSLITEPNIAALGFMDWSKTANVVEMAFESQDQVKLRTVFGIAQWVVLGKRFDVKRAEASEGGG